MEVMLQPIALISIYEDPKGSQMYGSPLVCSEGFGYPGLDDEN